MIKIGKDFTFEAAHRLQNHGGKCRNLHGHSYRVFVEVEGEFLNSEDGGPSEGMLFDFGLLSTWWKPIEAQLDHVVILQEDDPMVDALSSLGKQGTSKTLFPWPPTAEHLAIWIRMDLVDFLEARFDDGDLQESYKVKVRVYETAKSWAEAS